MHHLTENGSFAALFQSSWPFLMLKSIRSQEAKIWYKVKTVTTASRSIQTGGTRVPSCAFQLSNNSLFYFNLVFYTPQDEPREPGKPLRCLPLVPAPPQNLQSTNRFSRGTEGDVYTHPPLYICYYKYIKPFEIEKSPKLYGQKLCPKSCTIVTTLPQRTYTLVHRPPQHVWSRIFYVLPHHQQCRRFYGAVRIEEDVEQHWKARSFGFRETTVIRLQDSFGADDAIYRNEQVLSIISFDLQCHRVTNPRERPTAPRDSKKYADMFFY